MRGRAGFPITASPQTFFAQNIGDKAAEAGREGGSRPALRQPGCVGAGNAYDAQGTPAGTTRVMKLRSWGNTRAGGSAGAVNGHRRLTAGGVPSCGSTSATTQRRR